jgi:hypothetical protein
MSKEKHAPAEYWVVQVISNGYKWTVEDFRERNLAGIPPSEPKYAVIATFVQEPGWWREIARFHSLSRAESYAEIENEIGQGEVDYRGDMAMAAPADAPLEPPSAIVPENFRGPKADPSSANPDFEEIQKELAYVKVELKAVQADRDRLRNDLLGELGRKTDILSKLQNTMTERDQYRDELTNIHLTKRMTDTPQTINLEVAETAEDGPTIEEIIEQAMPLSLPEAPTEPSITEDSTIPEEQPENLGGRPSDQWPDDKVLQLEELYTKTDKSCRDIAKIMSEGWTGEPYTKNAVLGKANRRGLKRRVLVLEDAGIQEDF